MKPLIFPGFFRGPFFGRTFAGRTFRNRSWKIECRDAFGFRKSSERYVFRFPFANRNGQGLLPCRSGNHARMSHFFGRNRSVPNRHDHRPPRGQRQRPSTYERFRVREEGVCGSFRKRSQRIGERDFQSPFRR